MRARKYKLKGVKKHRCVGHRPKHNKKSVKKRREIRKNEERLARHIVH